MQFPIVVRIGGADVDLEISLPDAIGGPPTTVADVVEAVLGGPPPASAEVFVDDRRVALDDPVAECGMRAGSVVRFGAGPPAGVAVVGVDVVGGLAAGDRFLLAPGSYVVGSSPDADLRLVAAGVSGHHARLQVAADGAARVTDLHSHRGVLVDGSQMVLGSARLRVGAPTERPRRATLGAVGGRVPFHRRRNRSTAPPAATEILPLPPAPLPDGETAPRPSWAAIVAPLVLGLILAFAFGPIMAVFALLGPVTALVSWLEERRRFVRDRRRRQREHDEAVERFEEARAAAAGRAREERMRRHPDPAEVVRRAVVHDARLWERRPDDDTFLELAVGATSDGDPLTIDARSARTIGIAGRPADVDALARWLVLQIAVHHSPADVRIVAPRSAEWEWTKWLPHVGADESVPCVTVVDDPARVTMSPDPALLVVLARRAADLPAFCDTTFEVSPSGTANLGITADAARTGARALAPLVDAEAAGASASLPTRVTLADLLGGRPSPADIAHRWQTAGPVPRLAATVGMTVDGPLVVDLGRDGPHGLLTGTTGAGKSEFLRGLVAGLAANVDPEHLNIVLVDFKGGAAFAPLAPLPHVVGFVTDLDEHLAARALRSLEAELRRRERLLRAAGAEDLRAYLAGGHDRSAPLPALLVVVDEFAALSAEVPGFVDNLVDVAQRGRSLGVHLLLATQRAAGAVTGNLRANTNLRIALRCHDAADSIDVIGTADAASVHRSTPGRGFVRTGENEITPFQGATTCGPVDGEERGVTVRPFVCDRDEAEVEPPTVDLLAPLVDAIGRAAAEAGTRSPHRPWLDPLPAHLAQHDLPEPAAFALVDDPDHQCRRLHGWDGRGVNRLFVGNPADGGAALVALAVAAARSNAPDDLHLYALDFGPGRLAPVADLPHAGAVVAPGDRERQERLIRMLADEVERRRATPAGGGGAHAPTVLLLLDDYGAFHAAFDDVTGLPWRERLTRVLADGPAVGVVAAVAADRPAAVPPSVASAFAERIVFRLADPLDAHLLGLPPRALEGAAAVAGRGIHLATRLELQVASAARTDIEALQARWGRDRYAPAVEILPDRVDTATLPPPRCDGDEWRVAFGLSDDAFEPAALPIAPGQPVVVAGPAASGRSTLLATLADQLQRSGAAPVHAVALRPSPLRHVDGVHLATTRTEVAMLLDDPTLRVLLVDDAEVLDDPTGALARLVEPSSRVAVVVAGRSEALLGRYGHWTTPARRGGVGVVLRPRPAVDGELWQVPLPRRSTPFGPGRGYLVAHGDVTLVQVAMTPFAHLPSVVSVQ